MLITLLCSAVQNAIYLVQHALLFIHASYSSVCFCENNNCVNDDKMFFLSFVLCCIISTLRWSVISFGVSHNVRVSFVVSTMLEIHQQNLFNLCHWVKLFHVKYIFCTLTTDFRFWLVKRHVNTIHSPKLNWMLPECDYFFNDWNYFIKCS